jgi:stage II sporulation protein GA (sporulation sigma-E factor processing peptidase)
MVYLDQVFVGNLVMDYAILLATSKISRVPAPPKRLLAGAVLGALYALAVFIPDAGFLHTIWFKLLISAAIVAVSFSPLPLKLFITCLGCFFLASFTLGGLVMGIIFFISSSNTIGWEIIGKEIDEKIWLGILSGLLGLWVAGNGFIALLKKGKFEKLFRFSIVVYFGGRQAKIEALLDTGNQLKDPLTHSPVVIVEYGSLKALLPEEVKIGLEQDEETSVWDALGALSESSHIARFSAVPFQSLGNPGGMLLGFRPDMLEIEMQGKMTGCGRVVVGIYRHKLDPAGSYHALLGPNVLELTG